MTNKNIFHKKYFVLFIFLIWTLFIYFKSFSVGLLSDDFAYFNGVTKDGWNSILNNFNDSFFLPLSHFFQLVIFKLFGQNIYAFHVFQLLFHVLIGWQIYLVFKEINDKKIIFAFLTGFLFLILPYQTETTIWLASVSYVFCLFFAVLSIRYYLKGYIYLCYVFLISSIFCKEMGYVIPIIIFLIDFKQNQIPLFKKKLIPISIIIIICLSLRIFILDSLIGGYGENIHLNVNLNTVLKSIVAYFIKYFTFYRFSNSIFISLLVLTSIGLISIPLLKNLYIEKNFKKLFFITALFITTILPVINLEITSFHSIQSDRYGYFNTVVFAIILSQIICSWNKSKIIILSTVIISLFSILTFYDTKKWVVASEICNQYLKELITHEIENKNILILNIPDNYKGAYVLRNGINEYLNLNNINGNISLINYQSFNSQISGIKLNGSELLNVESDLIKTDSIVLKALLLDSIKYDFILYYQDKSFKKLNPESRLLLKKYFN